MKERECDQRRKHDRRNLFVKGRNVETELVGVH